MAVLRTAGFGSTRSLYKNVHIRTMSSQNNELVAPPYIIPSYLSCCQSTLNSLLFPSLFPCFPIFLFPSFHHPFYKFFLSSFFFRFKPVFLLVQGRDEHETDVGGGGVGRHPRHQRPDQRLHLTKHKC